MRYASYVLRYTLYGFNLFVGRFDARTPAGGGFGVELVDHTAGDLRYTDQCRTIRRHESVKP